MGGEQVFCCQALCGEVLPQVSIYDVDIAERPKVYVGQAVFVNIAKCRLYIAQLVRLQRTKRDTQAL